jgi:hypothetical protein
MLDSPPGCNTLVVTIVATIPLQYLNSISTVVDTVKPNLSGFKFKFGSFEFSC